MAGIILRERGNAAEDENFAIYPDLQEHFQMEVKRVAIVKELFPADDYLQNLIKCICCSYRESVDDLNSHGPLKEAKETLRSFRNSVRESFKECLSDTAVAHVVPDLREIDRAENRSSLRILLTDKVACAICYDDFLGNRPSFLDIPVHKLEITSDYLETLRPQEFLQGNSSYLVELVWAVFWYRNRFGSAHKKPMSLATYCQITSLRIRELTFAVIVYYASFNNSMGDVNMSFNAVNFRNTYEKILRRHQNDGTTPAEWKEIFGGIWDKCREKDLKAYPKEVELR